MLHARHGHGLRLGRQRLTRSSWPLAHAHDQLGRPGIGVAYGLPQPQGRASKNLSDELIFDPQTTTRATIIYEVPACNTSPWKLVPADSIEIQTGYTTVGDHVVPTPWIGYLKKHGLYVTISTTLGQRIALQIARSLHTGVK